MFLFLSLTCFEKESVVTWPGREEDSTQTVDPVAAHTTHTVVVALKEKEKRTYESEMKIEEEKRREEKTKREKDKKKIRREQDKMRNERAIEQIWVRRKMNESKDLNQIK